MPEPMREMIPTPIHDVKRAAPPVEETSPTREETPEAVRNGIAGLLNECAVGIRRLGDLLLDGDASEPQTSRNQTSRLPLSGSLRFPKRRPNYIKEIYTESCDYNQSIHQEGTASYEEGNSEQARAVRKENQAKIKVAYYRN